MTIFIYLYIFQFFIFSLLKGVKKVMFFVLILILFYLKNDFGWSLFVALVILHLKNFNYAPCLLIIGFAPGLLDFTWCKNLIPPFMPQRRRIHWFVNYGFIHNSAVLLFFEKKLFEICFAEIFGLNTYLVPGPLTGRAEFNG